MVLKTPQQYIDSIRQIKPRVFIGGKRIDDVTQHPNTRPVINAVAKIMYPHILTLKQEQELGEDQYAMVV